MCIQYEIKLTGKVQGVWCRKYIMEKAKELSITGFTQNLPDGSVFIVAESSDSQKLQGFIDWLRICSPHSRVDKVEILNKAECMGHTDFVIKK